MHTSLYCEPKGCLILFPLPAPGAQAQQSGWQTLPFQTGAPAMTEEDLEELMAAGIIPAEDLVEQQPAPVGRASPARLASPAQRRGVGMGVAELAGEEGRCGVVAPVGTVLAAVGIWVCMQVESVHPLHLHLAPPS